MFESRSGLDLLQHKIECVHDKINSIKFTIFTASAHTEYEKNVINITTLVGRFFDLL